MSSIEYNDIADLMTETLIEINNMLYRELVFPVFKTTNTGALLNKEFWFYLHSDYFQYLGLLIACNTYCNYEKLKHTHNEEDISSQLISFFYFYSNIYLKYLTKDKQMGKAEIYSDIICLTNNIKNY